MAQKDKMDLLERVDQLEKLDLKDYKVK